MKILKPLLLVIAICILPLILYAQKIKKSEGISWKADKVYSKILNEDIGFHIYLPDNYNESKKRYPVLFITPYWEPLFAHAAGVVRFLSEVERIPEFILVSADCNRWRDLVPTESKNRGKNTGKADVYLSFLEKEFFPELEKKYRAGKERLLWSHSIGGVFALYTLLSKPELFQYVIASSPYHPYEIPEEEVKKYEKETINHEKGFILKNMEKFLEKRTDQKNILYMIIGNEPELIPYFDETLKMFEKTAPKGLTWKSAKWFNENHQSIMTYALQAGLLAIFSDRIFK